jgi:hypothetical protein
VDWDRGWAVICYAFEGFVTACYGNVTLRMTGKSLVVNIVTPVTAVHPQRGLVGKPVSG